MDTPHNPQNKGGDNQRIKPEEHQRLNQCHVKPPRGYIVRLLLAQQPGEPSSFPPCSMEVPGHRRPVAVVKGKHPAQLLKGENLLKDLVLHPEIHSC